MSLASNLLFHLAKKRVIHSKPGDPGKNPATFSKAAYQEWRDVDLRAQFAANFDPEDLLDKDVLDFGCGEGGLSFLVATFGARSITGIDLNEELVHSALARLQGLNCATSARFMVGSDSKAIDLHDSSIDVILCFDVLEHILDYRDIIREWRRVLRPQGRVFITWVPWFHPYGHHIHPLVPLPWVHAFFSDKTLLDVCARIYDMPEFQPRLWDQDEKGNKRPNKWRTMKTLPDLNRLTLAQFERVCVESGLIIEERRTSGFKGRRLAAVTEALSRIPRIQEFFCSQVVYKLRKN
jgi:SAM-dependent methyltransferase